jgi:hypothetical protein
MLLKNYKLTYFYKRVIHFFLIIYRHSFIPQFNLQCPKNADFLLIQQQEQYVRRSMTCVNKILKTFSAPKDKSKYVHNL